MFEVPEYLKEALEKHYEEGILRQVIIRTPSGQFWNNLSVAQQGKWRELIGELGEDPESYLAHMRRMMPEVPK